MTYKTLHGKITIHESHKEQQVQSDRICGGILVKYMVVSHE